MGPHLQAKTAFMLRLRGYERIERGRKAFGIFFESNIFQLHL